jgi:hypothetical protein
MASTDHHGSDARRGRPAFPQPADERERSDETDGAWPVMSGPVTAPQARGAFIFGALGGIGGLLLGVALSLIPLAGLSWAGRLVLLGGIGLLAGSTAGFVYGGGREAELEEDVGNQIGPPPLWELNRDPESAREAVDDLRTRSTEQDR